VSGPHRSQLHPHFTVLPTRALTAMLLALALSVGMPEVHAAPQGSVGDSNGGDWLYADHDLAGTRYSGLSQIGGRNTTVTVFRLPGN
jgi:hypothetical protein